MVSHAGDLGLFWSKMLSVVIILSVALVAGLVPLVSAAFHENKAAMGLANAFAGGVFLAVGVCHLLPDAVEELSTLRPDLNGRFPVAFLLFILGYTVVLAVDRVLFSAHTAPGHGFHTGSFDRPLLHAEPVHDGAGAHTAGYVLLLALSLHGATEGTALGLQDDAEAVFPLLVAIVAHKWAEALALGISFASTGMDRQRATVLLTAFALSSPLGIALGMALTAVLSPLAVACSLAMAAGSFLYIGASDIVVEEFAPGQSNWLQLFSFLFGLCTMVLLTAYTHSDADLPPLRLSGWVSAAPLPATVRS
eukprot:GGOE01041306.1.p2 GENE.GGOE01041306.1~~GGOE01041306.1.p2  ORF type:complete len:315 (-),score=92.53 GGOE01041306.1:291-1211(-)